MAESRKTSQLWNIVDMSDVNSQAGLPLVDKVRVLGGRDAWTTHDVTVDGQIVLPSIKVTDGPIGARGDSSTGAKAVCLPAPVAMAATFDADLVGELGRLLGRETRRKQAQVLLAPTLNLARHPLGGRNFESFGEEPMLVAAMAVAYISGVQEAGVAACAKHFVANDAEWARLYVDTVVDQQTLREVYMIPFEAAVGAGVGTVMSAYPRLNGEHCSENRWLLNDVLRGDWQFDGVVISDWGAAHDGVASIRAGLDLEMPGPVQAFGQPLLEAVLDGRLAESELDVPLGRLSRLAADTGAAGVDQSDEQTVDLAEERALARAAATEAMVMIRNTGLLPLSRPGSVAVIGPNADPGVEQGGGSALVPAHYRVSPVQGISDAVAPTPVVHRPGCLTHRYLPKLDADLWTGPVQLQKFADPDPSGPFPTADAVVERPVRSISAFVHGYDPELGETFDWCWRWTGSLRVTESGFHQFGLQAVGPARAWVGGELVVDNWTNPTPGHGFFQKASSERVGTANLNAGTTVEVVVEWRRNDDTSLAGLALGHLPPVDEQAMLDDALAAAADAEVAVVVVGLDAEWETESHDRLNYGLPGSQDDLVSAVAAVNDNTIVVVNAGSPVAMPWFDEVAAVVLVWYPGQEFGAALADVLLGAAEPGGRLPVTVPTSIANCPTATSVPHADVRPELPGSGIDDPRMEYTERLHIGHRWYTRHGVDPMLPFGFGLGYTSFELGAPTLSCDSATVDISSASGPTGLEPASGPVTVSVPVTNVGDRPGKCVVQVYSQPTAAAQEQLPDGDSPRPRVLAGFAVARPDPGSTVVVDVAVPSRIFCRWVSDTDDRFGATGSWSVIEGVHRVEVALSSTEVVHAVEIPVGSGG